MSNVTVVKIGGSTFGSRDTTIEDIVTLQARGISLVVVHGGGGTVTEWLQRQGVATRFIRGERYTDLPTLEIATAVLAGLANKEITGLINIGGGRAVGISGVDGSLVESRRKNPELGYVGEAVRVNTAVLETLLAGGFVPVVSSICLYAVDRPDKAPPMINVNGDPAAGDIAAALKAEKLIFMTDVDGIRDAGEKPMRHLPGSEVTKLIDSGVISGGMIPKVNACLKALKTGAVARIIDGRKPHCLLAEFDGAEGGTTIE